jgi:hypothetical protein
MRCEPAGPGRVPRSSVRRALALHSLGTAAPSAPRYPVGSIRGWAVDGSHQQAEDLQGAQHVLVSALHGEKPAVQLTRAALRPCSRRRSLSP